MFIGYSRDSNSYKVVFDDKVMLVEEIERMPLAERWKLEEVQSFTSTPWNLHAPSDRTVKFDRPADQVQIEAAPSNQVRTLKRFRINKSDLDEFG